MPIIRTPVGALPTDAVEGFADGCERSVKGALHFKPNSTKVITKGELEHIKVKYPDLFKVLIIVALDENKFKGHAKMAAEAKAKAAVGPERASGRPTAQQRKAAKKAEAKAPPLKMSNSKAKAAPETKPKDNEPKKAETK